MGKGEVGAQGSWAAGLHWEEKSGESGGSLQAESQEALETCEPLSCGAEAPGKLGAQRGLGASSEGGHGRVLLDKIPFPSHFHHT